MITSDIVTSYYQCQRKAFLILFSNNRGIIHEYSTIIERELDRNKESYINKLLTNTEQTSDYSTEEIKKGTPILLNAKLKYDNLEATAVALIKNKPSSSARKHNYIPLIAIGTYKISSDNRLHLAFVAYVLSKLQSEKPQSGIIVRSGSKISTISLTQLYIEVSAALKNIENWINIESPQLPEITLNRHCPYCPFNNECQEEANKTDNLSLLSRISKKDIKKYRAKGIFTINQLSFQFKPRKQRKRKKESITPLRYRPELQALAIRTHKIYLQEIPEFLGHKVELFLDIEGIPDQDSYYLIGLLEVFDTGKKCFTLSGLTL